MCDRIAEALVNRAMINKRHMAIYGKYKLKLTESFQYCFYIGNKLKLTTPDSKIIASLIACYIDYDIRGLLLDD